MEAQTDDDDDAWGAPLAVWLGFDAGRCGQPRIVPAQYASDLLMSRVWLESWDSSHVN